MNKLGKNKYLRIEEITLQLNQDETLLADKIVKILHIPKEALLDYVIVKRAVDSRQKNQILWVYSVNVEIKNPQQIMASKVSSLLAKKRLRHKIKWQEAYQYDIQKVKTQKVSRPVIVGAGPSGLFAALVLAQAGLRPLVFERGGDVDTRVKDVNAFFSKGKLNTNSNVQFGEGGAGTFSDGKLYTNIKSSRLQFIFDAFIQAGAPDSIVTDAHPHIGTDRLRMVVKNLRQKIIDLKGEFRFQTCVTSCEIENDKISALIVNGAERIAVEDVLLAIGHSARDTLEMLYAQKIDMQPKAFAVGVRIEHLAQAINKAQYGASYQHPKLPTARYKLVAHLKNRRSVYTFCMCPGGYVVASSSESQGVVTNGMSTYVQNGENSNSALLVNVLPEDFGSDHPLAGIEFQRRLEQAAFELGGGDYRAPAQLVGDFLQDKPSREMLGVKATYKPGVMMTNLKSCLPAFVFDSLKQALPLLDRKIQGFAHPEALLVGVETRSSSPVRILRDEHFESNIKGVYPLGEGAGYAGGIVSSAVDGMKVAEHIIAKYCL